MTVQLRPYQSGAVDRLRRRIREKIRRLLLVAPTGAGKTVIAAYVMASAIEKARRVLFLAHRRELIHQTRRKLLDAGVPADQIGILMADDPLTRIGAPVQVASVDTLRNRERPPADLVIVDECHRSLARTYLDLISYYVEQGATILGLTATPYRADGGGLGDVYDALEIVATPRELIAQGFIVEPRVFSAPRKIDLSGVRTRGGEYVEADLAEAVNQSGLVGDIVEHWLKHAAGVRTVVFSVNVAHSQHITERFVAAGIAAEHLDGTTPTKERDAILARLESGETLVVSNCGVLCEGWDQPAVKCAVLARPTKSTGLYLQQAGRILRPWGEQGAIILDHAGNALAHGLPQDDRDLSLEPTQKKRGSAPTKECPECHAVVVLGARVCESCGYEFPAPQQDMTEENDGELVEMSAADNAEMREQYLALVKEWRARNEHRVASGRDPMKPGWIWHRFVEIYGRKPPAGCKLPPEHATAEQKEQALAELRETARTKGYKQGWATHRFRERFGHAPGVSA